MSDENEAPKSVELPRHSYLSQAKITIEGQEWEVDVDLIADLKIDSLPPGFTERMWGEVRKVESTFSTTAEMIDCLACAHHQPVILAALSDGRCTNPACGILLCLLCGCSAAANCTPGCELEIKGICRAHPEALAKARQPEYFNVRVRNTVGEWPEEVGEGNATDKSSE